MTESYSKITTQYDVNKPDKFRTLINLHILGNCYKCGKEIILEAKLLLGKNESLLKENYIKVIDIFKR